jgi:hypothetical protein
MDCQSTSASLQELTRAVRNLSTRWRFCAGRGVGFPHANCDTKGERAMELCSCHVIVCETALLFNRKSSHLENCCSIANPAIGELGKGMDKTSPDVQTTAGHNSWAFCCYQNGRVLGFSVPGHQTEEGRMQRSEFSRKPANTEDGCSADPDSFQQRLTLLRIYTQKFRC